MISVKHVVESEQGTWRLELKPEQDRYGGYAMVSEVTLNGQSPDEVAELRARRILLDEKLFGPTGVYRGMMNNSLTQGLMESSVKGLGEAYRCRSLPFLSFTRPSRATLFF